MSVKTNRKAYLLDWWKNNPDKRRAYQERYLAKGDNKERVKEKNRRWREANKSKANSFYKSLDDEGKRLFNKFSYIKRIALSELKS